MKIQPCVLFSTPLTKLYSTEKYMRHYSASKDSDDSTIATETVNTVHCLRLNCKTTQHFSDRICLRPQGESGETTVDGTIRNNRSHPWSRHSKAGSPVYSFPLQAWTGPEVSRRLRLPDFKTIGTWRSQDSQRYAPAAFTPRKYSWYSFLSEAESTPGP